MMMNLEQFNHEQYLNIETFRKNGEGVKTPVWFAQDGDTFLLWTQDDSGKAKRIRREGKVRIAPCTASGEVKGEWVDGQARADRSGEALENVKKKFAQKYGMMFHAFTLFGKIRKAGYTTIRITIP